MCSGRRSWAVAVEASAVCVRRLLSTTSKNELSEAEELFRSQQSQDHSPEAWGAFAEQYDRSFSNKFRRYSAAVLGEIAVRQSDRETAGALQLLDVGCGTGAMFDAVAEAHASTQATQEAAQHAPHWFGRSIDRYVGVDFSEEMVQFCRHRASHRPASSTLSASFQQVCVEPLCALACSADALICSFTKLAARLQCYALSSLTPTRR